MTGGPTWPVIEDITGHLVEDMEDICKNQVIKLEMATSSKVTRSWKVFVAHEVPQVMDDWEVQFITKEKVIYTKN